MTLQTEHKSLLVLIVVVLSPYIYTHQTEVIKGPCGSVGMTFRHVPATEGDAVHVSIETVTPNSPAALAELQKGDRLIAIGGLRFSDNNNNSV